MQSHCTVCSSFCCHCPVPSTSVVVNLIKKSSFFLHRMDCILAFLHTVYARLLIKLNTIVCRFNAPEFICSGWLDKKTSVS